MSTRRATLERKTGETEISVSLSLDGQGKAEVSTGIGFFDHLLDALTRHARFDLQLSCSGDLQTDDHHTVEDCAIVLGQAIDRALGERKGIQRFGYAYAPLDEALARAVIDLCGRGSSVVDLALEREKIGELACENIGHFVSSLAENARAAIHLDVIRGANDHHRAEAAIKALALAFKQAVALGPGSDIPSTKGVL